MKSLTFSKAILVAIEHIKGAHPKGSRRGATEYGYYKGTLWIPLFIKSTNIIIMSNGKKARDMAEDISNCGADEISAINGILAKEDSPYLITTITSVKPLGGSGGGDGDGDADDGGTGHDGPNDI